MQQENIYKTISQQEYGFLVDIFKRTIFKLTICIAFQHLQSLIKTFLNKTPPSGQYEWWLDWWFLHRIPVKVNDNLHKDLLT